MLNSPSEHDLGWYSDPDYDRSGCLIPKEEEGEEEDEPD
jgi:hypothetical protein